MSNRLNLPGVFYCFSLCTLNPTVGQGLAQESSLDGTVAAAFLYLTTSPFKRDFSEPVLQGNASWKNEH